MQRLHNKVAIVAGGAAGIGAVTARHLAREGAAVVIGDLDGERAQRLAASLREEGAQALGVHCDISDEGSVAALVAAALEGFGGLDLMHVNAADMRSLLEDTNVLDVPLEIFDRTMAVNLRGHFLCTRHAVPAMLERGGGAIIYMSSAAAYMGEPERVCYGISKSGILALMRHVASAWGRQGVRANVIAPGLVITDDNRAGMPQEFQDQVLSITRSPRLGTPDDISAAVVYLGSRDGEWINGQVLGVDGGVLLR